MFHSLDPWPTHQVMDDRAFADQLAFHASALRRYAVRLASSGADAEDLLQETSLKCWRARHRFAAGTNFMAWARTIMRNTFFTAVQCRRHEVDVDDKLVERLQTTAPAQHAALELQEALSALALLDSGQRRAVIMASEGVPAEAAAAALEIPVNTYKSRVRRGRLRLGKLIDGTAQPTQCPGTGPGRREVPANSRTQSRQSWVGVMIG